MISQIDKKLIEVRNSLRGKFLKIDFENKTDYFSKFESKMHDLILQGISIFDISGDLNKINLLKQTIKKGLKACEKYKQKKIRKPLICYSFHLDESNNYEILKNLISLNKFKYQIDIIEFHFGDTSKKFIDIFIDKLISFKFPYLISLSLSRKKLSNAAIIQIINRFNEKISKNLILEIDSLFYEGNNNDLTSSLQIISTADILNKELIRKEIKYKRMPLIISHDPNLSISKLAEQCDVEFNGIKIKYSDLIDNENIQKNEL